MADVRGVGNNKPVPPEAQNTTVKRTPGGGVNAPFAPDTPTGQPTAIPTPVAPGANKLLPDVLAGRDASQMIAAEHLRATGGASATDELLGLNRQPTMAGAFAAPPGNSDALRHITPTMRRTLMRGLLDKQRGRMRRLARTVRHENGQPQPDDDREDQREQLLDELLQEVAGLSEAQLTRAAEELQCAARMIDLLEELLAMQDYTISQMGTFAQG
jgi:hypothetical protein